MQSILTLFSKTDIVSTKIFHKTWHKITSLNSIFEHMIWIFHSLKTDATKLLKREYSEDFYMKNCPMRAWTWKKIWVGTWKRGRWSPYGTNQRRVSSLLLVICLGCIRSFLWFILSFTFSATQHNFTPILA